jgi:3-oxosteroid 1-dehydrogenase
MRETYDVVVIGSGAAGMMAALRAKDQGLDVLIVEKERQYGGTSATSGGLFWVPNHGFDETGDSREKALTYLNAVARGPVRQDRLEAFVDTAPEMARYLVSSTGLKLDVQTGYPDYYSEAAGAHPGRALAPQVINGADLGDDFDTLREQFVRFKIFNRYTLSLYEAFTLATRAPGWRTLFAKMVFNYWADFSWRRKTPRDRRLSMGNALIGGLRRALNQRGVAVWLNTALDELIVENGQVVGVVLKQYGRPRRITARRGVVIAAGGFEWNQAMRDQHFPVPLPARYSSTPVDGNTGEAIRVGQSIGAATEFMESAWWVPTMVMPIHGVPNIDMVHQMVFDVGRPHSLCVNQLGHRFLNESCSYDRFGIAMLEEQKNTGAAIPCWLIFDAQFRELYTAGGLMPASIMPDSKIPEHWWNRYFYRESSISGLANRLGLPPQALAEEVRKMNEYARTGTDPEFGRGSFEYDRFLGDPRHKPNPCLGTIAKAPFYAVPVNLGDLGTKGGLKVDAKARVLDRLGNPIPKLYAAGNASGSVYGDTYPGAGATLGQAMTFGYIAANDMATSHRTTPLGETVATPP